MSSSAKKSVNFNPFVNVVLVPMTNEYIVARLKGYIWWSQDDFLLFRSSARIEVEEYASHENCSVEEARFRLYQPDFMNRQLRNSQLLNSQSFILKEVKNSNRMAFGDGYMDYTYLSIIEDDDSRNSYHSAIVFTCSTIIIALCVFNSGGNVMSKI